MVPMRHRDYAVVFLKVESENQQVAECIRSLPGRKWSQTHQCWYLPEEKDLVSRLFKSLQGIAFLDYSMLQPMPVGQQKQASKVRTKNPSLPEDKATAIQQFEKHLQVQRYSQNTIEVYRDALRIFFHYFESKAIAEICNEDLVNFNSQYIIAGKRSSSYQNQMINAIKLYFNTLQNRRLEPELVRRPRRALVLPNVLNKEEVQKLLSCLSNVKHRCLLSLIYACGLRCGEALAIRLPDLDFQRQVLHIRQAKGNKDRMVPLSPKIIQLLHQYLELYKSSQWLFEGQRAGDPYDARSLQQVLKQAVAKAGLTKPVTLHWLRHSYATHLLDSGTNLRFIQELLGHNSSRTTEIYTHVSTGSLQKIISPFESL